MGTRIRPFSARTPKPLLPVLGVPTVFYAMASLAEQGLGDFVANIHHLPEKARAGFKEFQKYFPSTAIEFSDESAQLLGSGGGYKKAQPLLGDAAFLSLNGDVLSYTDPYALLKAHEANKKKGCLLTMALIPDPSPWVFKRPKEYTQIHTDSDDRVIGFQLKRKSGYFFSGWSVMEPEALRKVPIGRPSEFLPTILEPLIAERKVGFAPFEGPWMDIGDPQSWATAHFDLMQMLEQGKAPAAWKKIVERYGTQSVSKGVWKSSQGIFNSAEKSICYGDTPHQNALIFDGERVDL